MSGSLVVWTFSRGTMFYPLMQSFLQVLLVLRVLQVLNFVLLGHLFLFNTFCPLYGAFLAQQFLLFVSPQFGMSMTYQQLSFSYLCNVMIPFIQ